MATFLTAILALAAMVCAAPIPKYVTRQRTHPARAAGLRMINSNVKPNSYLVKMAASANATDHVTWANQLVANSTATNATGVVAYSHALTGYSAELDDDKVAQLLASPDVEWVEEDGMMYTLGTQTGATWGLQRISSALGLISNSDPTALTYTYRFNPDAGEGVDVYVIDTGVLVTHNEFGGRAKMVYTTPGLNQTDDNGHGSHVSGTVGGATFGVAKNVNILGVKVIAADGSGSSSDIIAGIDFCIQAAQTSGHPSVITMSIGGSKSAAVDSAATSAIAAGVHVIAAAGNDAEDTANDSPASAPGVIAVGSMNILDQVSSFSNFGSTVTVFAPGEQVVSCGISSNTATAILSGTSQATPHIAGIVALLLSEASNLTPSQMFGLIQQLGVSGQLSAVPASTTNTIAQNFVANTTIPQF
ncbi:subtilisin-like serine protease [Tulasnella sp. 332]|nr:subtilisin-like serine protease [Tulasnella sp. 332]